MAEYMAVGGANPETDPGAGWYAGGWWAAMPGWTVAGGGWVEEGREVGGWGVAPAGAMGVEESRGPSASSLRGWAGQGGTGYQKRRVNS